MASRPKTKKEAYAEASKALKLLKNKKGWKIDVWNNLGWCWCLRCGPMSLYKTSMNDTFHTLLSDDKNRTGGGACFWTEDFSDKDPNVVLARQLQVARNFIAQCQEAIDSVSV